MLNEIKSFKVNILKTNCYVLQDKATGKYALVDPGGQRRELTEFLSSIKGKIEYIILTHGHFDHISHADDIRKKYGGKIVINADEAEFTKESKLNLSEHFHKEIEPFDADILLKDGDYIMLGETKITMLATPGHTVGSACFIADDNIFSGDTLFKLSAGRTDFPTGDINALMASMQRLKNLDGDYKVFPGHDEETTLDYERSFNMYMDGANNGN